MRGMNVSCGLCFLHTLSVNLGLLQFPNICKLQGPFSMNGNPQVILCHLITSIIYSIYSMFSRVENPAKRHAKRLVFCRLWLVEFKMCGTIEQSLVLEAN